MNVKHLTMLYIECKCIYNENIIVVISIRNNFDYINLLFEPYDKFS